MTLAQSTRKDTVWHATDMKWRHAKLLTAGIDTGTTTTQAVVVADKDLVAYNSVWNRDDDLNHAPQVLDEALRGMNIASNDVSYIVGTGYGGANIPLVQRTVSEIICHARGANHIIGPSLKTVLTMGGRECVAVSCEATGAVSEFLANACRPAECRENLCNACGAAQGMGIEAVADELGVRIEDVGAMSLGVEESELAERLTLPHDGREMINDDMLEEIAEEMLAQGGVSPLIGALGVVCSVLAKSQAAGLLRNGWSKPEILAAYCATLAHQAALLVKRLGVNETFIVTGGVAKNIGVVKRLEQELGIRAVVVEPDPQITAALGAALYAYDSIQNPPGPR